MPALARGDYDEIWRQNDPKNPDVWAFVRSGAGEPVLVVINNGDSGSGLLRLPLRGHFAEGKELVVLPLERDAETGRLIESGRRYPVRDGFVEVEVGGRGSLILSTSRP